MKAGNIAKEAPIPADRLAEAGVWIARLHGDERDPTVESGFRQWLKAHDLNARAFELTTEVWEDSLNLRRVVPFAHDVAPQPSRRLRNRLPAFAAVAAVLALAVVGILFHLQREGVATAVGEQRLLTLEDGTRIYLNTATRVVVRYDRSMRRVQLKAGEALFDVAKKPNWPFVVEAGERRIRALGTSFVVRYDPDRTAVTLVDGRIAVTSFPPPRAGEGRVGAPSVALVPGQRLTFSGRKPARLDSPSLDKTTAWRRGQVVLDDMVLASAVTEMNRYNSVRVVIENPQAADLLVNGLFQAGDSVSFANAVAQAYGLRVVERPGEIVLEGVPKSLSSEFFKKIPPPTEVFL